MEVAEIAQLVASTGFSIVVAVWSLHFTFTNINNNQREMVNKMGDLTNAVSENSKAITELIYEIRERSDDGQPRASAKGH